MKTKSGFSQRCGTPKMIRRFIGSLSTALLSTANFSYTYGTGTFGIQGISQTSIAPPKTGIPLYSFCEIGPGPSNGTIDVSQVDLFSFPVTIQSSVLPGNPATIGNTLDSNLNSSISFSDNSRYIEYIDNLVGTGGCSANPNGTACAYLDLVSPYGTYTTLLNPGGFLNSNTTAAQKSKLQNAFDSVINKLWGTGTTITLNNGGKVGAAPQETFAGSTLSMTYPCNPTGTGCPTVQAIKFTGQNSGYEAYIFSPIGYANGCASNTITGCAAGSIASSGNQVFSGSGVFGTSANSEYTNLGDLLSGTTTSFGVGTYQAQVARLGLVMTQAMNHGVALMQCGTNTPTWNCWNNEQSWYPIQESAIYPDITQNLFSRFMHTATNTQGIPFFVQPPDAVQSAGSSTMGMAYGFSNDENPTPLVPDIPSPEVPSKMDGTVIYHDVGTYTITLGPWERP